MAYRNRLAKIVFDFDDPMGFVHLCSRAASVSRPARPARLIPAAYLDENETRWFGLTAIDSLCAPTAASRLQ